MLFKDGVSIFSFILNNKEGKKNFQKFILNFDIMNIRIDVLVIFKYM